MSDTENTEPKESAKAEETTPSRRSNPNAMLAVVMGIILLVGLGIVVIHQLTKDKDPKDAQQGGNPEFLTAKASVESRAQKILEEASALNADVAKLSASLTTAQSELASLRSQTQGQVNAINSLSQEKSNLTQQLAQYKSYADNYKIMQQQVESYKTKLAQYDAQLIELRSRPTQDTMNSVSNKLNTERSTKQALMTEVSRLKNQLKGMVDVGAVESLRIQVPQLQQENKNLRHQLQALHTKIDFDKLFIKAPSELPAKASGLYKALEKLEGLNEGQISAAYTRIATEMKAEVLQRVKFATGSSHLNFTDQSAIRGKVESSQTGDYFLVVGYASKSGDAASNQKLSANRATSVASIVNRLKAEGQDVRAVYLGQTDRFSKASNADNQLCEIWRIKK